MAYETPLHKESPIIPILSRINPIPRIDAYFFKIHSNIVPNQERDSEIESC